MGMYVLAYVHPTYGIQFEKIYGAEKLCLRKSNLQVTLGLGPKEIGHTYIPTKQCKNGGKDKWTKKNAPPAGQR